MARRQQPPARAQAKAARVTRAFTYMQQLACEADARRPGPRRLISVIAVVASDIVAQVPVSGSASMTSIGRRNVGAHSLGRQDLADLLVIDPRIHQRVFQMCRAVDGLASKAQAMVAEERVRILLGRPPR